MCALVVPHTLEEAVPLSRTTRCLSASAWKQLKCAAGRRRSTPTAATCNRAAAARRRRAERGLEAAPARPRRRTRRRRRRDRTTPATDPPFTCEYGRQAGPTRPAAAPPRTRTPRPPLPCPRSRQWRQPAAGTAGADQMTAGTPPPAGSRHGHRSRAAGRRMPRDSAPAARRQGVRHSRSCELHHRGSPGRCEHRRRAAHVRSG